MSIMDFLFVEKYKIKIEDQLKISGDLRDLKLSPLSLFFFFLLEGNYIYFYLTFLI